MIKSDTHNQVLKLFLFFYGAPHIRNLFSQLINSWPRFINSFPHDNYNVAMLY